MWRWHAVPGGNSMRGTHKVTTKVVFGSSEINSRSCRISLLRLFASPRPDVLSRTNDFFVCCSVHFHDKNENHPIPLCILIFVPDVWTCILLRPDTKAHMSWQLLMMKAHLFGCFYRNLHIRLFYCSCRLFLYCRRHFSLLRRKMKKVSSMCRLSLDSN